MKQITVMLCTAVVFIFAVASAQAAMLRPRAEIVAPQVTLGDLFDGLDPSQASMAIAQSPAPGREVVLDAQWIDRIARAYGIHWENSAVRRQIVLARASHRLGAEAVVAELANVLAARTPGGQLEIQLDNRSLEMHLPVDVVPSLQIRDLNYDPSSGRFAGTVVAPADGTPVARVPVTGRAVSMVEVPVVNRRIGRSETIGAADIDWIRVSADRAGLDVVMDAGELIGMSPRRGLAANTPVRIHDIERPIEVARGAQVTMVLETGALTISGRGRALDQGARGQVIRVINIDSNRTIEAVVTGPDTVTVAVPVNLASLP